jgi:hypothetical protein
VLETPITASAMKLVARRSMTLRSYPLAGSSVTTCSSQPQAPMKSRRKLCVTICRGENETEAMCLDA